MPHDSRHPRMSFSPPRKNDASFDNRRFTEPNMPTSDFYGHGDYEARRSPRQLGHGFRSDRDYSSRDRHRQSAYSRLSANHREPQSSNHSFPPEHREAHDRHGQSSRARKHQSFDYSNPHEKQSRPHSYPEDSQSVNHKRSPAHRSSNGPLKPILKRSTKFQDVDEGQNHQNNRAAHESRSRSRHAYIRDHMPHIPQSSPPQVQAHPSQGPAHHLPPGIIVYAHPPRKEKRKSFMERMKKAFAEFVADEKIPSLPPSQQGSRHNSSAGVNQQDIEDDEYPRDVYGIHKAYGRSGDHGYESSAHRRATPEMPRSSTRAPDAHAVSSNAPKTYQPMAPSHRSDRADNGFSSQRSRTEFADFWRDPMSPSPNTHHNAPHVRVR